MKALILLNEHGGVNYDDYLPLFDEAGVDCEVLTGLSAKPSPEEDEALLEAARGVDAILTSLRPFPRALIERLDGSVKAIVRSAMGYETIDVAAASERGIYVCNVPDYAAEEVAVHQVALLLAVVRKVVLYDRKVREGAYTRNGLNFGPPIHRLSRQCMGLLGFGRIARNVARTMRSFGCRVLAFDPYLEDAVFAELGVERVATKEEIFAQCDMIATNIPLTEESYHIIDAAAIARMKDGVVLVNTGRGALIEEAALVEGLKSGKIRGAGLDVLETEPLAQDSPLPELENVVLTPHVAYQGVEAYADLQRKSVEYTIAGARGEMPAGAVNRGISRG